MKIFLILALLAVVATMANATVHLDPRGQDQPFPQPQQPFPQPQQPFPQPQQPFPQPQQPFPQPQQPFPQPQHQPQQPFPQPQQPFPQPQQPFPQPQQPFPQPQQPFPQPQQSFPQPEQPFPQPQQPWIQQQQPPFQQITQQQLNQCQEFLVQKCKPVTIGSFLWSWILQQSSCQVIQQQCCQQLAQIPKQLRYPAIFSIVHAIIVQQQQQQQPFQPQPQQVGQGFIQPQQIAQFQAQLTYALQTLPAMCNVQVPLYYSTAPFSRISGF